MGLTASTSKLHMSLGSLAAWAEPKGFAAQDLFIAPKSCAPAGTAKAPFKFVKGAQSQMYMKGP